MTRIDLESYEERNDEIRFTYKGQYSCTLWGDFLYQTREKRSPLTVVYKLTLDFAGLLNA